MKKPVLALVMIVAMVMTTFAGGILTNTNQSAQWVRMMSRNASTQIDAVYYNPAGLTNLKDGLHFALMNQSIWQTKTINSGFPNLNDGKYVGDVKAPLFPDVYAVFKKDKVAFSIGAGPNAGGGSATFKRGLPSFELSFPKLVAGLSGLKDLPSPFSSTITGYNADLYFDGSSVFWGIQFGATMKFNDMVSGYVGVRYMPSKNTYNGYIHNIQLDNNGVPINAKDFLNSIVTGINNVIIPQINAGITQLNNGIAQLTAAAASYNGAATNVQQIITLGAGSYTLAQTQTAGYITSTQRATFEGALSALGLTPAQIAALNMNQVKSSFSTASTNFTNQATGYQGQVTTLNGQKTTLTQTQGKLSATASQLGDKNVKTEQTGDGWTPIIGANINVNEKLNIGLKYEFKTRLELVNKTSVDDLGLFPDGGKSQNDIPAILAVGVGYKPDKFFEAQLSYNLYFDKGVNWGQNVRDIATKKTIVDPVKQNAFTIRTRGIDKNYWELGLGLQANLTDNFALSLGGLRSKPGVGDSYNCDFDYENDSWTIGGGFQLKLGEKFIFDAGVMNTFYKDAKSSFTDPDVGTYTETFGKTTWGLGFGITYSIF